MESLVTVRGVVITGGPEHHRRGMAPAMKRGLRRVVTYWHRKYLRQHFRSGAAARYGYRPRGKGRPQGWKGRGRPETYQHRKLRVMGHMAPLTWSGLTRRMVQLPIPVKGTARSATGMMQVPWYVRMVPRKRNAPALGKELIATREDEGRDMAGVLHDDVLEQLKGNKERTHRKV